MRKVQNMAKSNLNEHDAEIAQMLADGMTVSEISKELEINKRTMEQKVSNAKKRALAETLPHLVANYLRKGLIK